MKTRDGLFGGKLTVFQKSRGYRFSLDAVLLAGLTRVRPRDRVVDLGTGCGVVLLLMAYRGQGSRLTGVELQADLAVLARENVRANGFEEKIRIVEADYRDLMAEFKARGIPLTVCVIDMDWHITRTGNASTGWTGYTWNRELFPDPPGFIAELHELGLRTALNLHPAEGVHPHEAQYSDLARRMGLGATVPTDQARVIIINTAGGKVGLLVHWISDEVKMDLKEAEPAPAPAPVAAAPAAESESYGISNRLPLVPGGEVRVSFSINND
ncbi:MAG: methyltransferase domain-containing protein, partial [Syntrophobacteraceae bacterium]|nr:methyltransferase domain-containing protein [Syntrophobacteraceae bacterium]